MLILLHLNYLNHFYWRSRYDSVCAPIWKDVPSIEDFLPARMCMKCKVKGHTKMRPHVSQCICGLGDEILKHPRQAPSKSALC